MAVTRCVCYRKSFAQLRQLAHQRGWDSVDDIAQATGCSTGCGSCKPYLQAMLDTGATCFAVTTGSISPQPCEPDPWDPIDS